MQAAERSSSGSRTYRHEPDPLTVVPGPKYVLKPHSTDEKTKVPQEEML